jgi:thiamine-monophosphate kinase
MGDDAAVIEREHDCEVITKDLLIEDQHFRLRYFTPAHLAKKALHVNLSDIAAMGATAEYAILGLAIPSTLSPTWLSEFLAHFAEECKKVNIYLIGGDTCFSPQGFLISITIIGRVTKSELKLRSGAKPLDILCLLGYPGDAYAGLQLLERDDCAFAPLLHAARSPTALIEEGKWLGEKAAVTAMIDTSDGLYIDLQHLCEASLVGAKLELNQLPVSSLLPEACTYLKIAQEKCQLIGGEDYGLLFTVQKDDYPDLKKAFQQAFTTPFASIGYITETPGIKLLRDNTAYAFHYHPFSHFGE